MGPARYLFLSLSLSLSLSLALSLLLSSRARVCVCVCVSVRESAECARVRAISRFVCVYARALLQRQGQLDGRTDGLSLVRSLSLALSLCAKAPSGSSSKETQSWATSQMIQATISALPSQTFHHLNSSRFVKNNPLSADNCLPSVHAFWDFFRRSIHPENWSTTKQIRGQALKIIHQPVVQRKKRH